MMRAFAGLVFLFVVTAVSAADRPNIVLILADDLGINDLACYGRKDHRTPHLDQLAAQGMRFTSAYCAQPICSPSRAALITGKAPARLHLTNFLPGRADAPSQKLLQPVIEGQLPLEQVTLAELLRDAGYATGCIGKWHLGGRGFSAKEQGFDTVVTPPANTTAGVTEGGKGEYAITAAAEQFIEENQSRPFFCYVAHNTPHIPFTAKPELVEKHAEAFNPVYAAVIETMDESIGRLLAKLDTLGLASRTLVIFASENGGLHVLESPRTPATHNAPFRAGKGYVYEGGLRVPLIVRWPDQIKPGSVSDTPVVLTDLMPTLLEAAGVDLAKATGPLDGVTLVKLLRGQEMAARPLFWHFPNYTNQGGRPAGAVREGEWKLVENYEDGSTELYNLAADPGERQNLAKQEPDRTTALLAKLAAWRKSVGAQQCVPNPEFDAALHQRLYGDADPSKIAPTPKAPELAAQWKPWRALMNAAVQGRKPRVTAASGDIRLHASTAQVHGEKLRYEPQPMKDTLGFWVRVEDWASWSFEVPSAGKYEVELLQGCGKGNGGSEVHLELAGQTLTFTVEETGHFQHFIARTLGAVELAAGHQTLAVRPKSKRGAAVMDLRRIALRPVD
ncbi:MAG: atsA 19 [Chthoniobacter sp.]|nr:atsA 19 [Chthoniobacter sp.]